MTKTQALEKHGAMLAALLHCPFDVNTISLLKASRDAYDNALALPPDAPEPPSRVRVDLADHREVTVHHIRYEPDGMLVVEGETAEPVRIYRLREWDPVPTLYIYTEDWSSVWSEKGGWSPTAVTENESRTYVKLSPQLVKSFLVDHPLPVVETIRRELTDLRAKLAAAEKRAKLADAVRKQVEATAVLLEDRAKLLVSSWNTKYRRPTETSFDNWLRLAAELRSPLDAEAAARKETK